jgi:hypothetical protein
MEDDLAYYARRAEDERRAAACAEDAAARRLHLELADMLSVKSALQQARMNAAASRDRTSAQ